MRNIWKIAACTCASLALALPVSAQSLGGYELESFGSVLSVGADGIVDVREEIRGTFLEPRHGLYRYVPFRYRSPSGGRFTTQVESVSVKRFDEEANAFLDEPFAFYPEDDFVVWKIGDADVTHVGDFAYQISYRVARAILPHEDADELYWNVTGHGWDAPFATVTADVSVAGGDPATFKTACYTGAPGSKESDCQAAVDGAAVRFVAHEPMTVSVLFPKGLVAQPTAWQQARWWIADHWQLIYLLIPIAAFAWLLHAWWHHGRDPRGRGVVVAQYEPVDGLRPGEIGTLADGTMHAQDFSATVVDLAVRGYLQIVEEDRKKFTLKKRKSADEGLRSYERAVLERIFGSSEEVSVTSHADAFVKAKDETAKTLHEWVAQAGYYVKNPSTAKWKYGGIGIAIIFILFFVGPVGGGVLFGSLLATGALFLIFAPFMPQRTEKGAVAAEEAQGFKLYLATAEKHRIQWQEKERIFERFLPYAMVFGVAAKWSQALAVQARQAPAWYVGSFHGGAFDANAFSEKMTAFTAAAQQAARPQSSGGGGGGGFSGGGFGGGGGGSW
jgi:uncharacterized protein (TIGR04222 family)